VCPAERIIFIYSCYKTQTHYIHVIRHRHIPIEIHSGERASAITGTGHSLHSKVQSEPCHTQSRPSVPVVAQNLQQSEERLLTRMVDMFQEMMEKMQQPNTFGGQFHRASREKRSRETVCKVCNDSSQTTISHCMSERLCFACHAPGHTKLNCPAKNSI